MPALETDRLLKLDPADHSALLAARIAERDAAILANDAERKRLRAVAGGKATKPAEDAKAAALATVATHEAAFAAAITAIKVGYEVDDLECSDEGHDIASGTYVLKAGPLLSGLAPIIEKRLPLTDAQCDTWIASYRVTARLSFEMPDIQRQINEYLVAHPPILGEPGHLIPEPQPLLDLRAALAAKQATTRDEQAKQSAIVTAVLAAAGEKAESYSYLKIIDTATGEIVLGRNPNLTKHDEVVLEPGGETPTGDGGKVIK